MKTAKKTGISSAKKRGVSAKKPRKAPEPFASKYREIDYDEVQKVSEILLIIRLDQLRNESGFFELKIPLTATLSKVAEKINQRHRNSCKNIRIYVVQDSQKKYMDVFFYKTFSELGLKAGENLNLYYEYEPVKHPLLEAGLV
jgi:hypothetical protein